MAVADSYTTTVGTPLTVPAPGVLANDSDPSGGSLTAALVHQPSNGGSVVLNSDGSFTYTPPAFFQGEDRFQYRASNAGADSDPVDAVVDVVRPVANLATSITGPADAVQDTDVTYVLTVTNDGPDAAVNPRMSAQLGDFTTVESFDVPEGWTCTGADVSRNCSAETLAAGASVTFTAAEHIAVNNPSSVDLAMGSNSDDSPVQTYTQFTTTVRPPVADLTMALTAPATAAAGADITYTATVHNDGPDRSYYTGAVLSAGFPGTVQSIDVPAGWTCSAVDQACQTTGYIDPGQTVTFLFVVRIAPGTTGTVRGAITVQNFADPNNANDTASAGTLITDAPAHTGRRGRCLHHAGGHDAPRHRPHARLVRQRHHRHDGLRGQGAHGTGPWQRDRHRHGRLVRLHTGRRLRRHRHLHLLPGRRTAGRRLPLQHGERHPLGDRGGGADGPG